MNTSNETAATFGIRKIVDCKVDTDGKQLYKVKWEPTWEPADSLVSCQHLIDKFWSFVNHAENNEELAQQHRKKRAYSSDPSLLNPESIGFEQHRLTNDSKEEVQRLIARTTASSNIPLVSPSSLLNSPQNNVLNAANIINQQQSQAGGIFNPQQNSPLNSGQFNQMGLQPKSSPVGRGKNSQGFGNITPPIKTMKMDSSDDMKQKYENNAHAGKGSSSNSSLQYIESFSNPYVKIVLVCKICSKEMSLKFSSNWKKHYLTHSSNDEKPHKCTICDKGFITLTALNKHVAAKHNSEYHPNSIKNEGNAMTLMF